MLPHVRLLRCRWLWRETGYITPRQWVVPRAYIIGGLLLSCGVFVGGSRIALQAGDGWLVFRAMFVGTSWGQAFSLFLTARRFHLPRYTLLALLSAAAAPLLAVLPLTVGQFGLIFGLFWTAVLVSSGLCALRATALTQKEARDAA